METEEGAGKGEKTEADVDVESSAVISDVSMCIFFFGVTTLKTELINDTSKGTSCMLVSYLPV